MPLGKLTYCTERSKNYMITIYGILFFLFKICIHYYIYPKKHHVFLQNILALIFSNEVITKYYLP